MLKFRTLFMAVMAAALLMSLSLSAKAQLPQSTVDQLTSKYRREGPCRDPWVTIAIMDVFSGTRAINGVGDYGDCDYHRYNGGSWSSYAELYRGVKTAFDNERGNLTITKEALANGTWRITTDGGSGFKSVQIISHDGGTLLSSDGAGLAVATSIVAQGGGNVISDGSTSVVGTGGSSFRIKSVSGNEMRINLGKSVLILRK